MAKKQKEEVVDDGIELSVDDICQSFAKKYKHSETVSAVILEELDNIKNWIDTGNLALNYACSGKFVGGGLPSGRVVELFGDSSSGKTLFATTMLRGAQLAKGIAVFIDAENSLSKDFASTASRLDTKKTLVVKADTLKRGFDNIHNAIRYIREVSKLSIDKPIVVVYDSIAASPSEREFADTTMDSDATEAERKAAGCGTERPGERARECSSEFRKLIPVLAKNNACVIFINQLRQKIGVMYGDDKTGAGGGNALPYYASLRIRTKARNKIKDKLDNIIGMEVAIGNVKNKCSKPFVDVNNVHIYYDTGINPFGGLLELMLKSGRVKMTSPGRYETSEKYGEPVKFQANKEKNEVPIEVLLAVPQLVDAVNEEQIQQYVDSFNLVKKSEDSISTTEKVEDVDD